MSKNMAQAATDVLRTITEAKPMDLILLLLVFSDTPKKKIAEASLKTLVKTGRFRSSLLTSFYQDFREVAKDFQPESLQLASALLKSEEAAYVDFAIEWFRQMFASQNNVMYKQREIIEKIILLMGNNDHTAKSALEILRKMTESEEDKTYLQPHCKHLGILLEKIDNFDLEGVATLNDVLYALSTSSNSASESLRDDLFILLQKQLSNTNTLTKCRGVLGATMAIKYLAGKPESCKDAATLFEKVRAGVKNCPRSQALFYDYMGRIIADTTNIENDFLTDITEKFQEEFVDTYMTDLNDYRGELVPKYELNDAETEPQRCVINLTDGKQGVVVPAYLRLLQICFRRINNGDLDDITVLPGCPVLMPSEMDESEPWKLDLMICCINWFRELVNGFVTVSEPDPAVTDPEKKETAAIMRKQVLKRLEEIMTLQGEFSTMLAMSDARYQPPPCYFHQYPIPAFVKVEKKIGKKGKRGSLDKTAGLPEWESWENGFLLCSKNPTYFRQMDANVSLIGKKRKKCKLEILYCLLDDFKKFFLRGSLLRVLLLSKLKKRQ